VHTEMRDAWVPSGGVLRVAATPEGQGGILKCMSPRARKERMGATAPSGGATGLLLLPPLAEGDTAKADCGLNAIHRGFEDFVMTSGMAAKLVDFRRGQVRAGLWFEQAPECTWGPRPQYWEIDFSEDFLITAIVEIVAENTAPAAALLVNLCQDTTLFDAEDNQVEQNAKSMCEVQVALNFAPLRHEDASSNRGCVTVSQKGPRRGASRASQLSELLSSGVQTEKSCLQGCALEVQLRCEHHSLSVRVRTEKAAKVLYEKTTALEGLLGCGEKNAPNFIPVAFSSDGITVFWRALSGENFQ
jgi:hypothetical protein